MTMQSIEPLHTAKRVEITAPSAFLEFMTAGKHSATLMDTIFSLPSRFGPSLAAVGLSQIHVHAKNSNGTTVGTFSIYNLLRGRFTLLPSFHSLPHYLLLL